MAAMPTAGRSLSLRYSASGPLEADQAGGALLGCPTPTDRCATRRWIDVDGDTSTFNSSSATVVVPAGAAVAHADLYWGGDLASDRTARCAGATAVAAPAPERADRVRVRLDAGNGADYVSVRASTVDGLRTANGRTYQSHANATRLFDGVRSPDVSTPVVVTVANAQVAQGADCAGAWTIVVVYRRSGAPADGHRTVLLFDGLAAPGKPRTVRPDGFRAAGPVEARLGVVGYGGRRATPKVNGNAVQTSGLNDDGAGSNGAVSDGDGKTGDADFDTGAAPVPDGAIAPGATSAVVSLPDGAYAAGAVLFSVRTEPLVRLDRTVTRVAPPGGGDQGVDGADVTGGERLRLSVEVGNIAARTLRLASLAESVPAGLSMVAGSVRLDGQALPDGAVGDASAGYAITLGDIPPGATRSVGYEAIVAEGAPSGIPVVARARLDFWVDHSPGEPSDSGVLFARSEQVEVVPNRVDLEVGMSVDSGQVPADGEARFEVTVTNSGAIEATGVVVSERLPATLAPLLAEPTQGRFDAVARRWNVGALAPDASATLTLLARVDASGAVTNLAEVVEVRQHDSDSVPDDGDPRSDDAATATVTGASSPRVLADLAVTQAVAGALQPGRRGRLVVTVTNQGPGVASGIAVTASLPTGLAFVTGGGEVWACVPDATGAVCLDQRDGLAGRRVPGEATRLEMVVAVAPDAPAELTATATVTSGVDDPQRADDTATTLIALRSAVRVQAAGRRRGVGRPGRHGPRRGPAGHRRRAAPAGPPGGAYDPPVSVEDFPAPQPFGPTPLDPGLARFNARDDAERALLACCAAPRWVAGGRRRPPVRRSGRTCSTGPGRRWPTWTGPRSVPPSTPIPASGTGRRVPASRPPGRAPNSPEWTPRRPRSGPTWSRPTGPTRNGSATSSSSSPPGAPTRRCSPPPGSGSATTRRPSAPWSGPSWPGSWRCAWTKVAGRHDALDPRARHRARRAGRRACPSGWSGPRRRLARDRRRDSPTATAGCATGCPTTSGTPGTYRLVFDTAARSVFFPEVTVRVLRRRAEPAPSRAAAAEPVRLLDLPGELMPMLGPNNYGKAEVRLVRVRRDGADARR